VIQTPLLGPTSSHPVPPSECDWADAPNALSLTRDHVHIWRVHLNCSKSAVRLFDETLAPEERARAERFHFDRDRRRFIAARAQLRMILARYVGVDPHALVFTYGSRGKPSLAQPLEPPIRFNLSHSGELALVGITLDRDIGVDLEEVRSFDDIDRLAERFFSPGENAHLRALPDAARLEAFFCCWTLKEAYVKATGDGLGRATESFDVAFARGEPVRLLSVEGDSGEASRWRLGGLAPALGYVGAAAVEGHDWSIAFWDLRL
jgi:4'-phosphopantetheinyl transferase